MNLPNKLTVIRVLLVPLFIFFVTLKDIPYNYLWALIVFSVASFTDFLDGNIARKNNLVTDFGKFMDPLADKILTTVAIIYITSDGVCSPIVLILILVREFAVSGVRMVASGSKGRVIAANIWGKMKTVLQIVVIIWYYFAISLQLEFKVLFVNSSIPQISTNILMWLVAISTVLSGWQYVWANRDLIKTAK